MHIDPFISQGARAFERSTVGTDRNNRRSRHRHATRCLGTPSALANHARNQGSAQANRVMERYSLRRLPAGTAGADDCANDDSGALGAALAHAWYAECGIPAVRPVDRLRPERSKGDPSRWRSIRGVGERYPSRHHWQRACCGHRHLRRHTGTATLGACRERT
jgi:hypothetical protein